VGAIRGLEREAKPRCPEGWDGKAGERVMESLLSKQ